MSWFETPLQIETAIEREHVVEELASNFSGSQSFLFFGRGNILSGGIGGALKLKEVSLHSCGSLCSPAR